MTSTNGPIRPLDPADPTPLHEQAAAALRRAIAEGQAAPGERLPPAVDLAATLGVNRNTVQQPQRTALLTSARELLTQARRQGYRRDDLVELIQSLP